MASQATLSTGGRFDTVVIGAGSAGCTVAARLAGSGHRVCLIEAGPDYGPFSDSLWPSDILDASIDAIVSHDWGFPGGVSSSRAKIVGGCSAHNGCGIVWPAPADLDEWVAAGAHGWSFDELLPYLERAEEQLRARSSEAADLEPWRAAFQEAALEVGFPALPDLNAPATTTGIGLVPVNAVGAIRWNAAFAYLDPVRARTNLEIAADTLVDRFRVRRSHVDAAIAWRGTSELIFEADEFVLTAGAFASPAILNRSGIGAPADLDRLGIPVAVDLAGVGGSLADHPTLDVPLAPAGRLEELMSAHVAARGPAAQCLLKARSAHAATASWDLILGPWTAPAPPGPGRGVGHAGILVTASKPRSLGKVSLRSRSPDVLPEIEHGFLSHLAGEDVAVLADGVRLATALAESRAGQRLLSSPVPDTPTPGSPDFEPWLRAHVFGNYHPCSTCKMGRPEDPGAVVDEHGRVHGLENLVIADASVFPAIPAANIHLTVVAVAERIAAELVN